MSTSPERRDTIDPDEVVINSDEVLIEEAVSTGEVDQAGGEVAPDELHALQAELRQVRDQVGRVDGRIDDYLSRIRPRTPQSAPFDDGFAQSLLTRLDSLLEKVTGLEQPVQELSRSRPEGGEQNLDQNSEVVAQIIEKQKSLTKQLAQAISERLASHSGELQRLRTEITEALDHITQLVHPPEAEEPVEAEPDQSQWRQTLFGGRLIEHPEISDDLDRLQDEILGGDAAATSLAGQLLIFRSASPDRMPQLLKDVGEAFYRCRPKTSDVDSPLERALVDALQKDCDQAGVSNRIELVHPGDRFDTTRHVAGGRGGMITRVHGWVVLRDTGRVYTKASVTVE